uniref:Ribonuclease H protein At1g65750 family n=1 Tax=Cajanus cajan TaxID=3821 RepID=A0A151RLF2_CAJCA|nr:Putative ribonuclease H protein At1g65750 family [Cajanus cajan]
MQTLWVPQSVCIKIDSLMRSFIWGASNGNKSWKLVNWDKIALPKNYGGLGVKEATLSNISMLGKLAWNIIKEPNKFWVQVSSYKYLRGRSLFDSPSRCSNFYF